MTRYRITACASADLEHIGEYSQERWGRKSRIEYLDRIEQTIRRLACHPSLGRPRDELAENVRTFPVGRHLIVFRDEGDIGILIVRVLHQSMDYPENL